MTQTADKTSLVAEAIAHYDALLNAAQWTTQDYDQLQRQIIDAKVTFGGRSSCPYLRPQFVSADQWAHVKHVSKLVNQAMAKAGEALTADADLYSILCLTEGEKQLIEPDPGYPWLTPTCRYDSFLTENSYQYVELNGECPAGPAFTTVLANLWLELPIMKQFMEKYQVETFDVRVPLLEMLVKIYETWRGNGHGDRRAKPQIAIVDYKEVPTYGEFELCRDFFKARGYETVVADPRELTYENGKLLAPGGFEIDLLYRRVLTNEFLEKFDELQAFWNAYKDGNVCVVNPFRSKLLHKKSIFAVITDERVLPAFSEEERQAVKQTVPWTRLVRHGKTQTFEGTTIDLVPWILENQQNLVMKPNDEYGGKGIFIGWAMSADEWKQAVEAALAEPYVVQCRVTAPRVDFPVWGPEGLAYEPQTIDLDPYMFFGEAHGFLTRLSTTDLCNVTAGGGIVPTFVVSRK
ncbi:MAG TPA: hypothetical protein V6D47_21800 [Oscillatoriaceae cyanobacterium]